jgi:hypothetical protein
MFLYEIFTQQNKLNLIKMFIKSLTPRELRFFSIRDNCGEAAVRFLKENL